MKTPRIDYLEILRQLKNNGFVEVTKTGSHLKLFNQKTRRTAIVPIHKGRDLPIGTIKSIERQSGISFE